MAFEFTRRSFFDIGNKFHFLKKSSVDFLIVGFAFLFYLICSLRIPMNLCPDEYMRFDIPKWIFNNNKLPIGDEKELINPLWGYSYGFSPYFASIVSVFFMRLVSLFTDEATNLFLAARFISVLSGTGTVLLSLLIGRELFKLRVTRFTFAVIVGFLPQFVFLSSYLNNDAFSVFCSALILLAWIKGVKNCWSLQSCILLGIGISLESLAYFFAYGWILASILLAILTVFTDDEIQDKPIFFGKRVALLVFIFSLLAGWYFVRNYVIYNGDILGMKASNACAELNAPDAFKPSLHETMKLQEKPFASILLRKSWYVSSIKSFICTFGYMTIKAPKIVYLFYVAFFIVGCAFWILSVFCRSFELKYKFFYSMCFLCMILPLLVSIYHSYAIDYQPQGRYLMSGLLPLALFVSSGYEWVVMKVLKKHVSSFMSIISFAYFSVFSVVFVKLLVGRCFGILE